MLTGIGRPVVEMLIVEVGTAKIFRRSSGAADEDVDLACENMHAHESSKCTLIGLAKKKEIATINEPS